MPTTEPFEGPLFPEPDIPDYCRWKSREQETAELETARARHASEHRETPQEQTQREQREKAERIRVQSEQAEKEAAKLKEGEENRRKQSEIYVAEVIAGEKIRKEANTPEAIAKHQEAERQRNSAPAAMCSACNRPHKLDAEGHFLPLEYSIPDPAYGSPSWQKCMGPVGQPDTYVASKGYVH